MTAKLPPRVDLSAWLTLQQVADQLGASVKTVRRRIASGDLTGYRFGSRVIRVRADEVDSLLRPIPTVGGTHDGAA